MPDGLSPGDMSSLIRNVQINFKVDSAKAEQMVKGMITAARQAGVDFRSATGASDAFGKSLSGVGGAAAVANRSLAGLKGTVPFLINSMQKMKVATTSVTAVLTGGAIGQATNELRELYKATIIVSNQFKTYGSSIKEVNKQVAIIGNTFNFTRRQSLALMSSIEQTFSYKPVAGMVNYMKLLENAVGANDAAMAAYSQTIGRVSQQIAGFQQLLMKLDETGKLSNKDIAQTQQSALRMALGGKMSSKDLQSVFNFTLNAQQGGQDQEFDQRNRYLKSMNEFEKATNEVSIALGEKLESTVNKLADTLKSWEDSVITFMSTLAQYSAIATLGLTALQSLGMVASIGAPVIGKMLAGGKSLFSKKGMAGAAGSMLSGAGVMGGSRQGCIPVTICGFSGGDVIPDKIGESVSKGMAGRLSGMFKSAGGGVGLLRAGLGGAVGLGAGWAAGKGVAALTGTAAEDGGFAASGASVAGRLAGGAAVGGPLGAIFALVGGIALDVKEMVTIGHDTWKIWSDIDKETARQKQEFDKQIGKMKDRGDTPERIAAVAAAKKVQDASQKADSRGQWYNPAGWFGGESRAKAQLQEAQTELQAAVQKRNSDSKSQEQIKKGVAEQNKKVQSVAKENENQAKLNALNAQQANELVKITALMEQLNMLYEQQKASLASASDLMQSQAELANLMAGGITAELVESYKGYVKELDNSNQLLINQQSIIKTAIESARAAGLEAKATPEEMAAAMQKLNEAFASNNPERISEALAESAKNAAGLAALTSRTRSIDNELVQNAMLKQKANEDLLRPFERRIQMQELEIQLAETQISLADNLAMGVAASAEMRMDAVRKISGLITIKRQEQLVIEKQIADAQNDQRMYSEAAAAGSVDAIQKVNSARSAEMTAQMRYKRNQNEILQSQQKQAEIVRTLRDGWISAISAMNTGVGMFTKIKIDRETRLGTLMSNAPKPVVGIQTGFAGPGRNESTRFSANGVGIFENPEKANEAFGAGSEAWRKAMDKRSPVGFMGGGGTIGQAVGGFSLWQELAGQYQNTAMAGAAGASFGESALVEMSGSVTDGVQAGMKKAFTPTNPMPVQIINAPVIPPGMKDGGKVVGGVVGQDSVTRRLQPGEYVINQDAAKSIGYDHLDILNKGNGLRDPSRKDNNYQNLPKNFNLEEFAKQHPDDFHSLALDAEHDVARRYWASRKLEEDLVKQLRSAKDRKSQDSIARKRIANRKKINTLSKERKDLFDTMSGHDPILTPTLENVISRHFSQKQKQEKSKRDEQKKTNTVSPNIASTANQVSADYIGSLSKIPEITNKWWEDSSARTPDGTPIAVFNPPDPLSAPSLFNALNSVMDIPTTYKGGSRFSTETSYNLGSIMSLRDGVQRNREISQFRSDRLNDMGWFDQSVVAEKDPLSKRINQFKEDLALAKGEKAGDPTKMFLPLNETAGIQKELDKLTEEKMRLKWRRTLDERQMLFSEMAFMNMVDLWDRYKNPKVQQEVPQLAHGGIVSPRPGGRLVNVAEKGSAEAVAPLPALQSMINSSMQKNVSTGVRPMMETVSRSVNSVMSNSAANPMSMTSNGSGLNEVKNAWINELVSAMRSVTDAAASRLVDELNKGA